MIAIDACSLSLMVNPGASPPLDPVTKAPVDHVAGRYGFFLDELIRQGETLIIPAPALAEVLIQAGNAGQAFVSKISKSKHFKIGAFDDLAALELAHLTLEDMKKNGSKFGGSTQPYQKVKYDRQIIAIAKVMGANVIYSDDDGVTHFAQRAGLSVIRSWEMPLPPSLTPRLFTP